jgi:hypothetical protein
MVVLGQDVPRLGNLGTLLGLPVMAVVALRLRLFGKELSSVNTLSALLLALVGVLSYLAVFQLFASRYGALVVGTVAITLALLAATRRGVIAYVAQRERLEHLATLGRFSAQMAHDLKRSRGPRSTSRRSTRGASPGTTRATSWTCCWSRWSDWTGWWAPTSAWAGWSR